MEVTGRIEYSTLSIGLLVQDNKFKIDFQDGGHLGFPIRSSLATFDLQFTSILPIKFRVNWPFNSGEGSKYIFKMAAVAAISDF